MYVYVHTLFLIIALTALYCTVIVTEKITTCIGKKMTKSANDNCPKAAVNHSLVPGLKLGLEQSTCNSSGYST